MGDILFAELVCGDADVVMGVLNESAMIKQVITATANMGREKRDRQPLPLSVAAVCLVS
jgi:hypothetical protein